MTTRAQTERDDVHRLIRHIASEPHLIVWLREHVAGHLEQASKELEHRGRTPAREVLARRADAHRRGDTPLW